MWAIVPVKSFVQGKSRLRHLSPSDREKVARRCFAHVLDTLRSLVDVGPIVVLTNGDDVAAEAQRLAIRVLRDAAGSSCSSKNLSSLFGERVNSALRVAADEGARAALVLMSDLPRLRPADVQALLSAHDEQTLVVAPDRHERGTNALITPLPGACALGHEDSFHRHCQRAREAGWRCAVVRRPGLALDIDWPADYEAAGLMLV